MLTMGVWCPFVRGGGTVVESTLWLVDAFTERALRGNPAGVVPQAEGLTERDMRAIAAEVHASETAFVWPASPGVAADFRLRYFTPAREVDLCGHATIGAICGLLADGRLPSVEGACHIETNVGVLRVRYGFARGIPWAEMGQALPQFRDGAFTAAEAAQALQIRVEDIDPSLPMGMSYTGLWDIFVPLRSVETVANLRPNHAAVEAWNNTLGAASTHVYAEGGVEAGHDFHTRDFSPAVGVPEDPATGTATGALMALLRRHGIIGAGDQLAFEQGYEIGRASVLLGRTEGPDDAMSVFVRGSAVVSVTGTLHL